MSTTLAKAGKVDRKWYVIDAAGKPPGRTAATAAVLLRGKNKVTFTPNVDCGDHVVIINCDKAAVSYTHLFVKICLWAVFPAKKWDLLTWWITPP